MTLLSQTESMSIKDVISLYNKPLFELIQLSNNLTQQNFVGGEIQVSKLVNIKTGGCTEDCAYCPQSAKHKAKLQAEKLMSVDEVLLHANNAKKSGASRLCLGAAWREVRDNRDFETVVKMVETVKSTGLEVCCTLGMLTEQQAEKLAKAGLDAYNHNLDTSESNYENIISTRTYNDRLNTLANARKAGLKLCSGGIIGMGEKIEDRLEMLLTLALLNPQPESVPINLLVPVEGTPLENSKPIPFWDLLKMIACARILMPKSRVRLSAGRNTLSYEQQLLCFMAGANSIFGGDKLLTTANANEADDIEMFKLLGLKSV